MELAKVDGHSSLSRDLRTQGIVNTDRAAMLAARKRKEQALREQGRVSELEEKIARLESLVERLLEDKS